MVPGTVFPNSDELEKVTTTLHFRLARLGTVSCQVQRPLVTYE